MKFVVVVVLSWNKKEAVVECVARAKALTGATVQVVVVDNASADDSVAVIGRAHPDVTILRETTNRGFAGGVNRGLAEAARRGADYAWLVNDDTAFTDDALVSLLDHAASDPRCGVLSPLLRDLDGNEERPQFANGLVDWRQATMRHNLRDDVFRQLTADGATSIVAGTAMLCDLRVYHAIGPFDERLFAYWEDTDYSVRASRAGFESAVVPTSIVLHAAPPSAARPPHYHYYMTRNEALFWQSHAGAHGTRHWQRRWLGNALESIGRQRDHGHAANVDAVVDGVWHAWTRRSGSRGGHAPAPRWFRRLLTIAPYLSSNFVRGDLRPVLDRVVRSR